MIQLTHSASVITGNAKNQNGHRMWVVNDTINSILIVLLVTIYSINNIDIVVYTVQVAIYTTNQNNII